MKKSKVLSCRITIDDMIMYDLRLQNKEFDKKLKDSQQVQKVQHTTVRKHLPEASSVCENTV